MVSIFDSEKGKGLRILSYESQGSSTNENKAFNELVKKLRYFNGGCINWFLRIQFQGTLTLEEVEQVVESLKHRLAPRVRSAIFKGENIELPREDEYLLVIRKVKDGKERYKFCLHTEPGYNYSQIPGA